MIYTIISILYLLLFSILSLIMYPLCWIVRKCNQKRGDYMALRYVQWGLRSVRHTTGLKLSVHGLSNIPKDKAVLFVGNHRSIFDTVVSYGLLPRLTGYIGKEELSHIPVVSPWMRKLYCLFLPRDDLKKSLEIILTAADQLKNGISMTIFPEGTRNKTEDYLLPFKAGAFKPAERARVPVVPMVFSYDGPVLEQSFPRLKKVRVVFSVGEPVETASYTRDDWKALPETLSERMETLLREQRKELFGKE